MRESLKAKDGSFNIEDFDDFLKNGTTTHPLSITIRNKKKAFYFGDIYNHINGKYIIKYLKRKCFSQEIIEELSNRSEIITACIRSNKALILISLKNDVFCLIEDRVYFNIFIDGELFTYPIFNEFNDIFSKKHSILGEDNDRMLEIFIGKNKSKIVFYSVDKSRNCIYLRSGIINILRSGLRDAFYLSSLVKPHTQQ